MWGIRPLRRLSANFPVSLVSFVELSSSIFVCTLYCHVEPCSFRLRHDSNDRTPTFTKYVEGFSLVQNKLKQNSEFEEQRHIRKIVWLKFCS